MISFQKRFLFVHIQRTGGNSVQSILQKYSEDKIVALRAKQDGIERFGLVNPKYDVGKHSTLAEYRAALGEEQFRGLFKFTCVRNPWERMVSDYFRPTRQPQTWDRKEFRKMVSKALAVPDFLRLEKDDANPFGNVDYIMRFENLAEDFRQVCARLDIDADPLPAYNRSTRDHYSKYYDDELRDFVRKRFATEIEHFGYKFENA